MTAHVQRAPLTSRSIGFRARWQSLRIWVELIRNLAVRDVEIRYKHSLLGLYWALINPLLVAAIYSFVFGVIMHSTSGSVPYVVFLVMGLTFWNVFNNGVQSATTSITGSASLLAKIYFPRIVMPTASVLARLIDFLFSLVIVVIFTMVYRVPVYSAGLWIVPLLLVQILFTLGISYMTAALNVLYRDVSQLVGLLLMIWMWFSPVIYAITTLPNWVQSILLINPMGAMLQAERDLVFTGHLTGAPYLWSAVAWSVFVFVSGIALFKRIEPLFAEVM